MERAVLIVTTTVDSPSDAVEEELSRRNVPVLRYNTDKYPLDNELTFEIGEKSDVNIALNNESNFRSLWYRRTRLSVFPEHMDPGYAAFSEKESRYALIGSLLALSRTLPTMSPPEAVWMAEHKPYQLAVAIECGLKIPSTLISNSPDEAKTFYNDYKPEIITKPVRTGYIESKEGPKAVYTSKIDDSHMEQISRLSLSPASFQPLVEKRSDIRVTIVGNKIFSAEICSQTDPDASVDWRRTSNPDLPHRMHKLPSLLEERLLRFMNKLGLVYGAIDLILDKNGDYHFLEINPGGQWLWLDRILDLGITNSISDWLECSLTR